MGLPSFKETVDLLKKGMTVEAQEKIMELRESYIELQEANLLLRQENQKLKESLELKAELVFKSPYYFAEGDDVPFCPRCWEKDRVAIHVPTVKFDRVGRYRECPECETELRDS